MKTLVLILSILGLFIFPFLSSKCCRQPIGEKLAGEVNSALVDDRVTAEFDGLQGRLVGRVSDENARERLLSEARAAAPAGRIVDEMTVAPSKPSRMVAAMNQEGKIDLIGEVSSDSTKMGLAESVSGLLGANELIVSDAVKTSEWWNPAFETFLGGYFLGTGNGKVEINAKTVVLEGEFSDASIQRAEIEKLTAALPEGFEVIDNSEVSEPFESPDFLAKLDGQSLTLSGTLPEGSPVAEQIFSAAASLRPTEQIKNELDFSSRTSAPKFDGKLGEIVSGYLEGADEGYVELISGGLRLGRQFPHPTAQKKTLELVNSLVPDGVDIDDSSEVLAATDPATLIASTDGSVVRLEGIVPDQATKKAIESSALKVVGPDGELKTQLGVGYVKEPTWKSGIAPFLGRFFEGADNGEIRLTPEGNSLRREFPDDSTKAAVATAAGELLPGISGWSNNLTVAAAMAPAPKPVAPKPKPEPKPVPDEPYKFIGKTTGEKELTFTGAVQSEAQKAAITKVFAASVKKDWKVISNLEIDDSVEAPAWGTGEPSTAMTDFLTNFIDQAEGRTITMVPGAVTLEGKIANGDKWIELGNAAKKAFGRETTVNNLLKAAAAPEPAPVAMEKVKPEPKPAPAAPVEEPKVEEIGKVIIFFDTNSSYIRGSENSKIADAVNIAKDAGGSKILLKASTDLRGDREYNRWLSGERAKRVLNALADGGIAKTRLEIQADGETEAVDTTSEKQLQEDRRVEVRVIR